MSKNSKKNVPKLRFPAFNGEWTQSTLKKEAEVNPKTDKLPPEFIYLDLESVTNGMLVKEERIRVKNAPSRAQRVLGKCDILYQTVRPYQKNNYFFNKEGNYVASTGYAQIIAKGDAKYLFQILHTESFVNIVNKWSTGTSYPAISPSELVKIPLYFPSLTEQQKIAGFLSKVDQKIQQLTAKRELLRQYKKGVMQKLFTQQTRFKDEDGNAYPKWKEQKLNYYLEVSKLKNLDLKYGKNGVLSVSGEFGIINQIEFHGRSFAGESVANYGVVEYEDIVYTKSPLKNNPFGIIKANKRNPGIVSTLYAVYKPKDVTHSSFIEYYFQLDDNTNQYLRPLVNKGAKNDMKISDSRVLIDPVLFPSKREQIRIVGFLETLDRKIDDTSEQLKSTQYFKRGLLQQMFVQL